MVMTITQKKLVDMREEWVNGYEGWGVEQGEQECVKRERA